jgi:hypothetical protein
VQVSGKEVSKPLAVEHPSYNRFIITQLIVTQTGGISQERRYSRATFGTPQRLLNDQNCSYLVACPTKELRTRS